MAKYLIHSSPPRLWYVYNYLVPSMKDQGISESDILILNDGTNVGCLMKTMNCFATTERNGSGVWHLQDDILICNDFKKRTEEFDYGLVCGYCYDTGEERTKRYGYVSTKDIWMSFPCIRIPNGLARDVGKWFFNKVLPEKMFTFYTAEGKHDDVIFLKYIEGSREDELCLNLNPTLVAHIDYLIGGSLVNPNRKIENVGKNLYFPDPDLIDELADRLKKDGKEGGDSGWIKS